MKKFFLAGIVSVALVLACLVVFRGIAAQNSSANPREPSQKSADKLQVKIDEIKKSETTPQPASRVEEIEVSEAELESYVLFALREKIPIQMDSIDVQLTPGAVASDTQMTFTSNSTGNPMFDALMGGTHNLFVKGKLHGDAGRGKFDLEEIKVDGIPVPKVLVQTLFDRYVKPKYPEADLKEPFDLPWGIRSINIQTGRARITY